MTQLTAKPFTARPLAARPFTAYPFGESTSVSNPLVWLAAYPDSDGVMQAQITGEGTPSFTVDDGLLLPDHENIYRTTAEDTAPWHGARKVTNILPYSENFPANSPINSNMTVTTGVTDASGGSAALTLTAALDNAAYYKGIPLAAGSYIRTSCWIRRRTGTGGVDFHNGSLYQTITTGLTTSWQRFSANSISTGTAYIAWRINTSGDEIDICFPQIEDLSGATNQNPSEYVPTDIAKAGAPELEIADKFETAEWNTVAGWAFNGLSATAAGATSGVTSLSPHFAPVAGKKYVVSITVDSISGDSLRFRLGNTLNSTVISAAGTYTDVITATNTTRFNLAPNAGTGLNCVISDYSIKEATPGYEYYSYENGNTVVDNVVVPAKGATLDPLPSLYGGPSYTNSLTYSSDLTQWTQTGTSVSALDAAGLTGAPNTATTLTDDDGAAAEYVQQNVTIPNDSNTVVYRVFVDKDSDETRFAGIVLYLWNGTQQNIQAHLNTKTGAVTTAGSVGTVSVEANSAGSRWEVIASVANNSTGNTVAWCRVYPAHGTVFGTADVAATGSIIVGNVELHLNKTIAQVRGSSPIVTAASTVTTSAISMSYDIANHSDTQGAYYAEWTPFASYTEVNDGYSAIIRLSSGTGYGPINPNSDGRIESTDSDYTGPPQILVSWLKSVTYKTGSPYGDGLHNIVVDGVSGEDRDYSGHFTPYPTPYGGIYVAGKHSGLLSQVQLIRNIRRYSLPYQEAKDKIDELMS